VVIGAAGAEADMGFLDKAKDLLGKHDDKVDDAIEKAGDVVDDKTENKYAEHVDKGQDFAATRVREYADEDQPEQPA
jgi:acetyl-CoA carboxylase carboxyltransferase component